MRRWRLAASRAPPSEPNPQQRATSWNLTMPLQNRVNPFGDIVAIPQRGYSQGIAGSFMTHKQKP